MMPEVLRVIIEGDPVINMFVILGLGLLVGRIRIGGIALGSVAGVLVVGLLAGHLDWEIPTALHDIGFILFIYAVGFQVGPRFFGAFRQDGGKYFLLALTTALSASALAVFSAQMLDFDLGYAGGMLAGATVVETFRAIGFKLAVCGGVVTVAPVLIAFPVGRRLLRMNAAIVFGALTGSMTSTAALSQVTSQARGALPSIGYAGTYAFANVLLSIAGSAITRV